MDERWASHREQIDRAVARSGPEHAVGFLSAAAVHGMPLMGDPPPLVEMIRPGTTGGRRDSTRWVRALPLDDDEVTVVDGVAVTTVARTLFDIAATRGRGAALVPADAALRRGVATLDEVTSCAARHPGRHGLYEVWAMAQLADGRSRSPATTLSRYRIWKHGLLPPPDLDVETLGFHDTVLGRADFWWDEGRVIGLVDDGPASLDRFPAEARSELRHLGVTVVEWSPEDLGYSGPWLARLHDALDRRVARPWEHPVRCADLHRATMRGGR